MKIISKTSSFLLVAVLFLGFTACSDDDDNITGNPVGGNTAFDLAQSDPNFSILVEALERTNLDAVLDGPGQFTVFAPDNDAFAAFLQNNNLNSLDDVPNDLLTNVLLNHVVGGVALSTDLSTGYINTSAVDANGNNLNMYVSTQGGVTLNGDAQVVAADLSVDNGVVHAVDEVIGLPTLVTFAVADPNFSSLTAAVVQENLAGLLSSNDPNNDASPFTVFAPTNMAFDALVTELGANDINDILANPNLATILQYHVVTDAAVRSTDLSDGFVVTPAAGGTFTINLSGSGASITDANARTSNIIAVDVTAINGVIHAIDTVILPQ
ncbi:MAG: fasciclin domain-containing protein [Flavobacteriaceae bacterium]|nr:fasciclin domain-containing protein [Flavobacteriaceae bacterium]